jgi:hypothetical protein
MNWKDSLNFLKPIAKITAKSLVLIFLISLASFPQQDTTRLSNSDTVFVMQKSLWLAVLQSAVLPGLGQIYNESYIKAPIIWGIAGLLVYGWIYNDDLYDDYRNLAVQDSRYISYRDFYRDQRDLFTIYIGLVYLLNLVDAYVDAHLFDFNVTEDFLNNQPMLNLRVNF